MLNRSLSNSNEELINKLRQIATEGKILPESLENILPFLQESWMPAWAAAAIAELVEAQAWVELNDRFYRQNKFGTAGIRGRTIGKITPKSEMGTPSPLGAPQYAAVGSATMNDWNVLRATAGLYRYCDTYLKEEGIQAAPRLVIAYDVRHFSRHFAELTASAWVKLGGNVKIFEAPRSSPQLSYSVRHYQAVAGVVITASHNPPYDNGYKVFFADGAQIVRQHDDGIIKEVGQTTLADIKELTIKELGHGIEWLGAATDEVYIDGLRSTLIDPQVLQAHPPRLVYSPVHGTGATIIVPALARYGAAPTIVPEQLDFDGRFPTVKSPNPQNAEALTLAIKKAEEVGIGIVLATDPDCDRMGGALRRPDGSWWVLSGNTLGSLMLEDRLTRAKELGMIPAQGHPNAVVVKTNVTTPLQDAIAQAHGVTCINVLTGFKWIGAKLDLYEQLLHKALRAKGVEQDYDSLPDNERRLLMLEHSRYYIFGGEESYGYLGCDRVRDKDGNAAVLMFAELAARWAAKGKTLLQALEALYLKYGYYTEGALNIAFEGAAGAVKLKKLIESYKKNPPTRIGDFVVRSVVDCATSDIVDADGETLPKAAVMIFTLDDGTSFAVRPSGTEPNIRYYCFTHEAVREPADLAEATQRAENKIEELKGALKADAEKRAS